MNWTKLNIRPIVIEKRDQVGGTRTENYKGYYFDMGGHRFFTKSCEVNEMWREILGPDFCAARFSRIFYRKRFFYYPLRPLNALKELGLVDGFLNQLCAVADLAVAGGNAPSSSGSQTASAGGCS